MYTNTWCIIVYSMTFITLFVAENFGNSKNNLVLHPDLFNPIISDRILAFVNICEFCEAQVKGNCTNCFCRLINKVMHIKRAVAYQNLMRSAKVLQEYQVFYIN